MAVSDARSGLPFIENPQPGRKATVLGMGTGSPGEGERQAGDRVH